MLPNPRTLPLVLTTAVRRFFVSIARILATFGISFSEAREMLKQGYVTAAKRQINRSGERSTRSRVALLTGLSRQEVTKLWDEISVPNRPVATTLILGKWFSDTEWRNEAGKPLTLPFDGVRSFSSLCKSCTTNYTPRTILTEFEARGNVEVLPGGQIKFITLGTVPLNLTDVAASSLRNAQRLLETVDYNLSDASPKRYERMFWSWRVPDHLVGQAKDALREVALNAGKQSASTLASFEAHGDVEHNSVGLGIYYFERKLDQQDS